MSSCSLPFPISNGRRDAAGRSGATLNYCIALTDLEPSFSDVATTGAITTPVSSPSLDAPSRVLA